jgi:hypothetical protein
MSALPAISHHLFVAAIEEPISGSSVKFDKTDLPAIELEVLDWTHSVPERVMDVARPSTPPSKL